MHIGHVRCTLCRVCTSIHWEIHVKQNSCRHWLRRAGWLTAHRQIGHIAHLTNTNLQICTGNKTETKADPPLMRYLRSQIGSAVGYIPGSFTGRNCIFILVFAHSLPARRKRMAVQATWNAHPIKHSRGGRNWCVSS